MSLIGVLVLNWYCSTQVVFFWQCGRPQLRTKNRLFPSFISPLTNVRLLSRSYYPESSFVVNLQLWRKCRNFSFSQKSTLLWFLFRCCYPETSFVVNLQVYNGDNVYTLGFHTRQLGYSFYVFMQFSSYLFVLLMRTVNIVLISKEKSQTPVCWSHCYSFLGKMLNVSIKC